METIRIRGLEEGRAALAQARAEGRRVALASIPDGAASAGAEWFAAVAAELAREFPETLSDAILDCGDSPGAALGALRSGLRTIRYDGPDRTRMRELVEAQGARLVDG